MRKWFKNNVGNKYPKKSIELEHAETAKRIVIEGYGITIIPESAVKHEIAAGLLKQIEISGFDHSIDRSLRDNRREASQHTEIKPFYSKIVVRPLRK